MDAMTNAGAEHIDSDILAHFISLGVDGAGSYALEASILRHWDERKMTDVTTMTLTEFLEFLEARFGEDEAVAQASRPDEHLNHRDDAKLVLRQLGVYTGIVVTSGRVLAECAAKRAILELHRPIQDGVGCMNCGTYYEEPCDTLRALALPYAEHPDYDKARRS